MKKIEFKATNYTREYRGRNRVQHLCLCKQCDNDHAGPYYPAAEVELLLSDMAKCQASCERMEKAIETHRYNVWGDGPVGHDEDVELYKALSRP